MRKYQLKDEDKLARFKYGRQSNPIQLPELAENGDDLKKAQNGDEWGAEDGYKGGEYDDGLEFQQLEDSTQY